VLSNFELGFYIKIFKKNYLSNNTQYKGGEVSFGIPKVQLLLKKYKQFEEFENKVIRKVQ